MLAKRRLSVFSVTKAPCGTERSCRCQNPNATVIRTFVKSTNSKGVTPRESWITYPDNRSAPATGIEDRSANKIQNAHLLKRLSSPPFHPTHIPSKASRSLGNQSPPRLNYKHRLLLSPLLPIFPPIHTPPLVSRPLNPFRVTQLETEDRGRFEEVEEGEERPEVSGGVDRGGGGDDARDAEVEPAMKVKIREGGEGDRGEEFGEVGEGRLRRKRFAGRVKNGWPQGDVWRR